MCAASKNLWRSVRVEASRHGARERRALRSVTPHQFTTFSLGGGAPLQAPCHIWPWRYNGWRP